MHHECTKECQQDAIECIRNVLEREKTGAVNWISSVTCNIDALPEGCNISGPIQLLAVEDVRDAQNADLAISRVLVLKWIHADLKHKDKLSEDGPVWHHLREWAPSADWWRWHSQERDHEEETVGCSWFPTAHGLQTPTWGDGTLGMEDGGSCQGMLKMRNEMSQIIIK